MHSPLVDKNYTYDAITDKISSIVLEKKTPKSWYAGLAAAFCLVLVLFYALAFLFAKGVGLWGIRSNVVWGFDIVNFVWWIGIGHAGTFISAMLLLMRREWRTSINRFTEAMTLFAIGCAALFPLVHLGRPWKIQYLVPHPNTMGLWPQFQSPLVWDFFAVCTYAIVSFLFWYLGLLPDLATFRDRASRRWVRGIYGILALGWRGSAKHWHRYETLYLALAGLAAPLVISVHTVVSLDFAATLCPGWHATILPPYFVAGAIFSGFAMVLTLAIPVRKVYGLEDFITIRHLENMAKVMLATGYMVAYAYVAEVFTAWYGGHGAESYTLWARLTGPYAPHAWALLVCNVVVPQLLWFKKVRTRPWSLFVVALVVNAGMWLERFVIIVTSLSRNFLPSSWGEYAPTGWDWATFLGSLGLFSCLFFLFARVLPLVSAFEMRQLLHRVQESEEESERP